LIASTQVKNSKNEEDILNVYLKEPLVASVDTFFNVDTLGKSYEIYEDLEAPIEKGQVVGKAIFTLYDQQIPIDLVAGNAIEEKSNFNLLNVIADILIVLFRIAVIVAIIIIIIRLINRKNGKKSRNIRLARVKKYNARFRR